MLILFKNTESEIYSHDKCLGGKGRLLKVHRLNDKIQKIKTKQLIHMNCGKCSSCYISAASVEITDV